MGGRIPDPQHFLFFVFQRMSPPRPRGFECVRERERERRIPSEGKGRGVPLWEKRERLEENTTALDVLSLPSSPRPHLAPRSFLLEARGSMVYGPKLYKKIWPEKL